MFTGSKQVAEMLAERVHGRVGGCRTCGRGSGSPAGVASPSPANLHCKPCAHDPPAFLPTSLHRLHSTLRVTPHSPQIFVEDAGFDWKILGPDVQDLEYVAWQVRRAGWQGSGVRSAGRVQGQGGGWDGDGDGDGGGG